MKARSVLLASVALVAAFLTACSGGEAKAEGSDSAIPAAAKSCDPAKRDTDGQISYNYSDTNVAVRSSEPTMEAQIATLAIVGCLVDALDGPESIGDRYLNPGATGGSEAWDGYEANWSLGDSALFTIDAK